MSRSPLESVDLGCHSPRPVASSAYAASGYPRRARAVAECVRVQASTNTWALTPATPLGWSSAGMSPALTWLYWSILSPSTGGVPARLATLSSCP